MKWYFDMSKEREKGRRWDGKSRISTNQYKENWEEIFGKKEREQKEIEEKLWKRLKDWNLKK